MTLFKFSNLEDCWIWQRSSTSSGYGMLRTKGRKNQLAHRFVFSLIKSRVPKTYELDHLCRNRACINPIHLEIVDHLTNMRRGINAQKLLTKCKNGHPFSKINTYVYKQQKGGLGRGCKACRKMAKERFNANKKNS